MKLQRIGHNWATNTFTFKTLQYPLELPRWCSGKAVKKNLVKKSACQWRRHKRGRFNPWVRKIPWRKKSQPTPVFLPGKFHGQRSGHKRIRHGWATEHTKTSSFSFLYKHTHTFLLHSLLIAFSSISAFLDPTPNVFLWSVNQFFINCWNLGVIWCGLWCTVFLRSYVMTEARYSILN